jgi:hypothetical protein
MSAWLSSGRGNRRRVGVYLCMGDLARGNVGMSVVGVRVVDGWWSGWRLPTRRDGLLAHLLRLGWWPLGGDVAPDGASSVRYGTDDGWLPCPVATRRAIIHRVPPVHG